MLLDAIVVRKILNYEEIVFQLSAKNWKEFNELIPKIYRKYVLTIIALGLLS